MNKTTHPIEPEELMAYLDGELSKKRAEATAAHLSECGECRGVVSELRGVSQALKTWEIASSETQVPQAISAALEDETRKQGKAPITSRTWPEVFRQRWQSVAWIGAFAAFALFAYFGSVSFREKKVAPFTTVGQTLRSQDSQYGYVSAPNATSRPTPQGAVTAGIGEDKISAELMLSLPAPQSTVASKGIAGGANVSIASGPMVIRTAQLTLITKEFDGARSAVEAILKRHRGYIGELKVGGSSGSGRILNATLRVPADQLDASLTDLKTLGRVETESQSGQDVTSQYVDLQARLSNARTTEQRLTDMLRQRTGKLSDVLEVEQEIDRVRGEIEQMEAERKTMSNQVSFATLNATITEDYKAQLQVVPPSTSTRLSNAAVEGYKSMVDGVVGLVLFLLENGPTPLLWGAVLFFPARWVWKKVRRGFAH